MRVRTSHFVRDRSVLTLMMQPAVKVDFTDTVRMSTKGANYGKNSCAQCGGVVVLVDELKSRCFA
jgi:hypothetical protein